MPERTAGQARSDSAAHNQRKVALTDVQADFRDVEPVDADRPGRGLDDAEQGEQKLRR